MTALLVELCAGTAALSWSLFGARFPVSRMGSKAGYADAIKGALGLHGPPEHVLLSKQQREWLTMNREPVAREAWPARDALPGQGSLFGGAA